VEDELISVITPDKRRTRIRGGQALDAFSQGYEFAVPVLDPSGKPSYIPASQFPKARTQGYRFQTEKEAKPGMLSQAWEAITTPAQGARERLGRLPGGARSFQLSQFEPPPSRFRAEAMARMPDWHPQPQSPVIMPHQRTWQEQIDYLAKQRDEAFAKGDYDTGRRKELLRGISEDELNYAVGSTSALSVGTLFLAPLVAESFRGAGTLLRLFGTVLPQYGFTAQGVYEALRPRGEKETKPEALQRRLYGASQAVLAGSGITRAELRQMGAIRPTVETATSGARVLPALARGAVLNEGVARQRAENALQVWSETFKGQVKRVNDAVYNDAKTQMATVAGIVDEKFPDRPIATEPIRAKLREKQMEIVKIPENWPPSLRKLSTMLQMPSLSFKETMQLRSEIGRDAFGKAKPSDIPGVKIVSKIAYDELSRSLQRASAEAGQTKEWDSANEAYASWIREFKQSPVDDILTGQSAEEIMKPAVGSQGVIVRRILGKHGLTDATVTARNRYRISKLSSSLATPTKWHVGLMVLGPWTHGLSAYGVTAGVLAGRLGQRPGFVEFLARPRGAEIEATRQAVRAAPPLEKVRAQQPRGGEERFHELPPRPPGAPPISSLGPQAPLPGVPPEQPPTATGPIDPEEAMPDTAQASQAIEQEINTIKRALKALGGRREEFSDQERAWIENRTGVDVRDKTRYGEAIKELASIHRELVTARNALEKPEPKTPAKAAQDEIAMTLSVQDALSAGRRYLTGAEKEYVRVNHGLDPDNPADFPKIIKAMKARRAQMTGKRGKAQKLTPAQSKAIGKPPGSEGGTPPAPPAPAGGLGPPPGGKPTASLEDYKLRDLMLGKNQAA
jgi:hypothetical protein